MYCLHGALHLHERIFWRATLDLHGAFVIVSGMAWQAICLADGVVDRQVFGMRVSRYMILVVVACLASGCGRERADGFYRDAENAAITYQLRADDTWVAEIAVDAGAGIFPHGFDRRLEGSWKRRGNVVVLACSAVRRQDPMTGEFAVEPGDPSAFDHRFLIAGKGRLVPVGADGRAGAGFASDLNPLGARELVRSGE